jgi:uncharacterized protein YunC (DUF1805 family)
MDEINLRGKTYKVFKSNLKNKQYKVVLKNGRVVNFGDPNSSLKSHIPKRKESYCARSKGIKTKPFSPNEFSRAMWEC